MSFLNGAVGWPTVCDCGISWSYSLSFWFQFWHIRETVIPPSGHVLNRTNVRSPIDHYYQRGNLFLVDRQPVTIPARLYLMLIHRF